MFDFANNTKMKDLVSIGHKYLVMARVHNNETLQIVSTFLINTVIDGASGEVETYKKLQAGTILIKT